MAIFKGSTEILRGQLKLGGRDIQEVYKGGTKIWPPGPQFDLKDQLIVCWELDYGSGVPRDRHQGFDLTDSNAGFEFSNNIDWGNYHGANYSRDGITMATYIPKTNNFSFSFWTMLRAYNTAGASAITGKYWSSDGGHRVYSIVIYGINQSPPKKLTFNLYNDGDTNNRVITDDDFPLNQVVHGVFIKEGRNYKYYQNGQLTKSGTFATDFTLWQTNQDDCKECIGAISQSPLVNYLDGLIGQVAIWDRALVEEEVDLLWGNGNPYLYGNW